MPRGSTSCATPTSARKTQAHDAETTPLRHPEHFRYDFNLPDVAEVWRRGSVIASWLLDLTAKAMASDPELAKFSGHVSDSGEGRWTLQAAIEEGASAPVLSAALYQRVQLARGGRVREQDAIGDALRVRRPRREAGELAARGRRSLRRQPTADASCVGHEPLTRKREEETLHGRENREGLCQATSPRRRRRRLPPSVPRRRASWSSPARPAT